MAAKRNYAREYATRVVRAEAKGYTRSQARGHARPEKGEVPISTLTGTVLRGAAKRGHEAKRGPAAQIMQAIVDRVEQLVLPIPWSEATPGGTRDFVTRDRDLVLRALSEAREANHDVMVGLESPSGVDRGRYARRADRRKARPLWAYYRRVYSGDLVAAIREAGGNVDEGLRDYVERWTGASVGVIDRIHVKEFGAR